MEEEIVNRVANSQLITFDLETLYAPGDRVLLDIRGWLHQEMILKEKEFREFIRLHDWAQYKDKQVAVTCSVEVIIPTWAYLLLSVALEPYAARVVFGTLADLELQLFMDALQKVDWEKFRDAKVVIKGCGKVEVPLTAYMEVAHRLQPLAASLMFGEACSTVPLYKRKAIR